MELGKSSHTIAQALYRDLLTGTNCFKSVGHGRTWKVEGNSVGSDKVDEHGTDGQHSLGSSVVLEEIRPRILS
jgi:hypothetical protein